MKARIHDFVTSSLDDSIEVVVFGWSNRFGHCYECGIPAAFSLTDRAPGTFEECEAEMRRLNNGERGCASPEAHGVIPESLRCAVCAANAAADGDAIWRLDAHWEGDRT